MDEAELLGDRIAIISNGSLQCCGTSLFLKNVLGEGNILTIAKKSPTSSKPDDRVCTSAIDIDLDTRSRLTTFIQFFAPSARLKAENIREYHYLIPLHERANSNFWHLFNELDLNSDSLGITSFGIKDVTLEEVFLKAVQLDDTKLAISPPSPPGQPIENIDYIYADLETGIGLLVKQLYAMVVKRYLYNKRNWKSLLTQIILPAMFICVAMTVALSSPGFTDLPPIELSPSQYYALTGPDDTYVPYSGPEFDNDNTLRTLHDIVGMGSTCVLNRPNLTLNSLFNEENALDSTYFGAYTCKYVFNKNADFEYIPTNRSTIVSTDGNHTTPTPRYYPNCQCRPDNVGFVCSDSTTYVKPPAFRTVTHETLQNITSNNASEYYLYTSDLYRLKRYGGLTFDNNNNKQGQQSSRHVGKRIATVWYNHKGFHSMPVYLNTMNNAILRTNMHKIYPYPNKLDSNEYGMYELEGH
jgi:hypothetical protein